MGLLHLSYHRYILVKETRQIQTSSLTFCAFDIELFKLYRCLTGNLSTLCRDIYPVYLYISLSHRKSLYFMPWLLSFLSLDKCVLVPLLEDHIVCDCAGILQEKEILSNCNLQSQPEKKKMHCPNIWMLMFSRLVLVDRAHQKQNWDLSKNLHDRIFWPKILHTKSDYFYSKRNSVNALIW